jgi:glyoxylase-like metal-dependent hydrolase (beta-lactamase superfamily II)
MARYFVQLAPGILRIPTVRLDAVNTYALLEDDGSVTLVDAGVKGSSARIHAALAEVGRKPTDVTRVLLTHAHGDHAGGARELWDHGAGFRVHERDAGDLAAGRPAPPSSPSPVARLLLPLIPTGWEGVRAEATFTDGELLDVAGGLRVVHTPGHTPGHVSFLHEGSGVLITGDALFNFLHRITFSPKLFCYDAPRSRETAARLGDLDYEVAAFIHGPEIRQGARDRIRRFLRRKRVA